MTHIYDSKTGRHSVSEGNITVSGPTAAGCEQRLAELLRRQQEIRNAPTQEETR